MWVPSRTSTVFPELSTKQSKTYTLEKFVEDWCYSTRLWPLKLSVEMAPGCQNPGSPRKSTTSVFQYWRTIGEGTGEQSWRMGFSVGLSRQKISELTITAANFAQEETRHCNAAKIRKSIKFLLNAM